MNFFETFPECSLPSAVSKNTIKTIGHHSRLRDVIGQSYLGQTSRALRSRTREHKRAIFTGDRNSLLTQHCIKNNHNFDLDDVKIIDRCSQWSKRLFLEAWHSIRDPNAINEHIYIPDIYKALGNPK